MLLVAGVIHLLPLPGALGAGALARLYGLEPAALADPNLALLLRHRAVLFGVVGALLVAAASLLLGLDLVLGLESKDTVLLVLTLFVATLTLGTGRTTVLQGAVHLVVFAVFLFLAASP